MKRILLFLALFGWVVNAQAQTTFKAHVSRDKITTDENLMANFTLNMASGNIDTRSFVPPNFEGFIKRGPMQSQEYRNYNGQVSASYTFSYQLTPTKTGKIKIGSAKISVDGKTYTTKPLTVMVVKGTKKPAQTTNQPGGISNPTTPETSGDVKGAFLSVETTNSKPYINQAVGMTYRLYVPSDMQVGNYNEIKKPQFNGFWIQDVDNNISGPYTGEVNGKPYYYYVLRKKLLFPQQIGKLVIKPLTISLDVAKPYMRNFGPFRMRDYKWVRVKLTSGKKVIQVKALPEADKPIDFSGAVGNFDLNVKADRQQVKSGEPVNVVVSVRGKGNLKLFELPRLKAPEGLEVYDPKHSESVKTTFNGNSGRLKDEYVIVPNQSGKFIIPSMRFVFFDPDKKTYITKTSKDIVLMVSGGNYQGADSNPAITNNPGTSAGADFRFIKEQAHFVSKDTSHFYQSKLFKSLLIIPVVLAFLLFGYKKYQSNKVYDASEIQRKKRKSLAQKYLKDARKSMQDKELFYANLEKAIHNFLKSQLKIDTAELDRENIRKRLLEKNISEDKINDLFSILNKCDMARYAPASHSVIEEDYKETERIMNELF